MDENKKNVDESWKEQVAKEKVESKNNTEKFAPPEADFNFFVTTLGIQASIFLGIMPNPSTNQKEEDISQAKFIIDTLGMLKDKTKGNLIKEEENLLENILYELRVQYLNKQKGGVQ